jgi:adenylosuccinate lyase
MDTAAALRYRAFVRDVVLPDLLGLQMQLITLARANAHQVQIGRTHGQHAVPITFGFAVALYVSRVGSRIEAILSAQHALRGKFSGAVGAFNALSLLEPLDPARYERELLRDLGLTPSATSIASQIVEPEPVTDLTYAVVSCFSVLANIADDIRHLVRTEIGEIVDHYEATEVGSSTMPHKMNPKNFENVKSLWKEFMPRMSTVFMDQLSEHQRDLTNSASARFLPELFCGFSYAVSRLTGALRTIETNPERMRENVDSSKYHIVAEPLYIALALQGYPDAYDRVMELSRNARRNSEKLLDAVRRDLELAPLLDRMPAHHQAILEEPARYIGDAVGRTLATCDHWEGIAQRVQQELDAQRKAAESIDRVALRTYRIA